MNLLPPWLFWVFWPVLALLVIAMLAMFWWQGTLGYFFQGMATVPGVK